ncbi:MAG: hypothetical protein HY671_02450 [Chloroflexi bacterium]|nr:hypothetical protein [Chloroflexota bacterium]
MPITGKQFQLGIDSEIEGWMKNIHSFLSEHAELAYTLEELASELKGFGLFPPPLPGMGVPMRSFVIALDRLAELGAVDARIVREQRYFRVGPNPLDL